MKLSSNFQISRIQSSSENFLNNYFVIPSAAVPFLAFPLSPLSILPHPPQLLASFIYLQGPPGA